MVALTQSGHIEGDEYNLGESRIIDYKGDEVASILSGEGLAIGEISINSMYEFRSKSPVLNDIKTNYEVKTLCKR
jgi:predicted amidohydrolase